MYAMIYIIKTHCCASDQWLDLIAMCTLVYSVCVIMLSSLHVIQQQKANTVRQITYVHNQTEEGLTYQSHAKVAMVIRSYQDKELVHDFAQCHKHHHHETSRCLVKHRSLWWIHSSHYHETVANTCRLVLVIFVIVTMPLHMQNT